MLETIMLLIPLLCRVESNNDPFAIGDDGDALGILQIHRIVIEDVNHIYNMDFNPTDRTYEGKSQLICLLYLAYYGRKYYLDTGREPTKEVLARIWNGGPNGYIKESTIKYWNKVKRAHK